MAKDIAPVEKSLLVPLHPKDAFDLFTDGMRIWWPLDSHSMSAQSTRQPAADVTVEPQVGGKIYETLPDGNTAEWATITDWTPGARLAFDWYVGRDPAEATQVAVTFLPEGNGTRVLLVHDGFGRLADGDSLRAGYHTGWDMVLGARYGGAARARAA
ncbi:MAG: SRPBCC domain-containing protein [Pseudomonadota bacterium]